MSDDKKRAFYGPCGALILSHPIEGVDMRPMPEGAAYYYGGRYMVGESMARCVAQHIAELLGYEWEG